MRKLMTSNLRRIPLHQHHVVNVRSASCRRLKLRCRPGYQKSKSLDEPTAVADQAEDVHERLKRYAGGDQQALTRAENRLTGKGRYELDPSTRKLTPLGKQMRLRRRLNITMGLLSLMIIITWLILFFI